MRRFLLALTVAVPTAACSNAGQPPRAAELPVDADLPLPRHAILPTIPASRRMALAPDAGAPPASGVPHPSGAPEPSGKAPHAAAAWARDKYADLLEAGGRITLLTSPVLAKTLKNDEVYQLAVGSRYPLATVGPLARRMLVVDVKKKEVVLDFDAAQLDSEAAQKLGGFLAPASSAQAMADAAGVVAVLAPLDPYFPNPGEPEFK